MTVLSESVRHSIEHACERLIRRFALLNDAGDYEQLTACFTPDGVFARPSDPDHPVQGRTAILEFFRSRPPRVSRHLMLNTVVDAESETEARAYSDVVLYTAPPGPFPCLADAGPVVGAFRDRLRRVDGLWLFVERRGSLALKIGTP